MNSSKERLNYYNILNYKSKDVSSNQCYKLKWSQSASCFLNPSKVHWSKYLLGFTHFSFMWRTYIRGTFSSVMQKVDQRQCSYEITVTIIYLSSNKCQAKRKS